MLTLADINAAQQRVAPYVHKTPVLTSHLLNQWLGHNVYFKVESLQKVGAFKARGACNALAWLKEQEQLPKHIVANSSGNHAQAVAWAAAQFQIPATIFMPTNVSKIKAQATKSYGANVVLCNTRQEADERVADAAEQTGFYWLPPYNHEQIICGQGTCALEALQQQPDIDAVFAPCGGGGLLSGTYIATNGIAEQQHKQIKVIGVEPLIANDAACSLRENKIMTLSDTPSTLADGAKTLSVGSLTFEYLKKLDGFYEVEERAIAYWTQWLNHLLKVRIEPTSAMSMAAAVRWLKTHDAAQASSKPLNLLIIISGGNIDQKTMQTIWQTDYLTTLPQEFS
ncbi:serine/threonine dehydratase [Flocculibacter collagenilyticus]|uniref:serine/threonine dehydratase n=1 Tax=Flocculibacter collagenilyticus TaxID=2744479 RepID=UPI0018F59A54|nr:serine/threonine dehydratase [Flocculibacter collagenilyticus]